MTAIIRAASAHDLLALVPALAGFTPSRSLVCVAFTGTRTAGVLRHDLPADAGDHAALVAVVIGTVCRMPGVDAIVPIVYTDATFREVGGLPERALLDLIADRAVHAGFQVKDALCQAGDGWASAFDSSAPAAGHPLAMVSNNAAAREAAGLADVEGGDQSGTMPPPDARTAPALASAFGELRELRTAEQAMAGLGRLADPIELVDSLLSAPRRSQPVRHLAWFLHLASLPAIRDAMMLHIAFGRVVADLALDASDAGSEDGPVPEAGMGVLGRARTTAGAMQAEVDDLLARLITGQTMLRPDRRRVERAFRLIRGLVADAPADARPGACCIAAWLAWCLGRGSVAGSLLDAALEIDPGHTMARLLDEFIGSGALPDWAFIRDGR
ncbi:DUF4192 family protein [Agromyces salentinus]|uniref:DUF4192 family protein n=1 Tax=Agromyces salentinus TaxID=269421 RepID=A0ABN2MX17_9MICO|nr:DUF4192 family protein [Agromyces salentinus]